MATAVRTQAKKAASGATTVKLSREAHATLAALAQERGLAMSALLAELIEQARRQRFFDEADAAYERLQADPAAWADYQAEMRSLEGTLLDGLKDDPWVE
jgi:hypothetical protein